MRQKNRDHRIKPRPLLVGILIAVALVFLWIAGKGLLYLLRMIS